ncbi:imidazole glycerol phosphate synthase subunit HisH [Saxibacter everestensis]|uniref:Imidazole glycerol phosphate synthase subunit HisH n=1 Tax=Saxibacter everestensis TaxID=2909229 RepID=A0ABY8QWF2_9MICO|nr:imidazole glycerol phosphate synthase subunit HisH [Brevibacteriaceae bacterium ZFBP1038]
MTSPSVVVLDYGSGNVRSAFRAVERTGASVELTPSVDKAMAADGVVIPGVGAFSSVVADLRRVGGDRLIADRLADQKPVLAICVGLQVLFTEGVEGGEQSTGLGIWPGTVRRLAAPVVPHMGWATVEAPTDSVLFDGIGSERFYFVHSYAATQAPDNTSVTWAEHGERFVAAVEDGALSATQFHPEKSGDAGRRLLTNWVNTLR